MKLKIFNIKSIILYAGATYDKYFLYLQVCLVAFIMAICNITKYYK